MLNQKRPNLLTLLKQRQKEEFVGRQEQVESYERNMSLPLESKRFIFNISGQGGVGKTYLMRRFRQVAEGFKAITTWTDDNERDIPTVLGKIVEQLVQQGCEFKKFSERYKVYRQHHREIESDPEAPQGIPGLLGRTVAKTGIHIARRTPAVGVVFDFIDEEAVATQASEWMTYLAKKIKNKDEVLLLQSPVDVLTPLFVEGLQESNEKDLFAFFFDTYERTFEHIDSWLRRLIENSYGEVPANLIISIAGRDELDRNLWAPYEGLISRFPLDPFTPEETLDYLSRKGITDPQVIDIIIRLSGQLPLLVAMLATESPNDPKEIGDPSGTAIERFLKWVEDPTRKQVALNASLPRQLNRDILAVLVGDDNADSLFNWLKQMPFVGKDSWKYHNVVRTQMLRHKRRESPQDWSALHSNLAKHFEMSQNAVGLDPEKSNRDASWQNYAIDAIYHRLCESPQQHLSAALNGFLNSLEGQLSYALRRAEIIEQAGVDLESRELEKLGGKLIRGVKGLDEEKHIDAIDMFSSLIIDDRIASDMKRVALSNRGALYRMENKYANALKDLTEAIRLSPDKADCWVARGRLYRDTKDYKESISDYTQAISLQPTLASALTGRGTTYLKLEKLEEARRDFDCAIAAKPDSIWALAGRGRTYRKLKMYPEALRDFNRILEIDPEKKHMPLKEIGLTFKAKGDYKEAATSFLKALTAGELCPECWLSLAETYKSIVPIEEVPNRLREISFAKAPSPTLITLRGEAMLRLNLVAEALKEFETALALDENSGTTYYFRALAFRHVGRYEEALADLQKCLDLQPDDNDALRLRGDVLINLGLHSEALKDVERAIIQDPIFMHAGHKLRGDILISLNRYEEACKAYELSVDAKPDCGECWMLLATGYKKAYSLTDVPRLLRESSISNTDQSDVIVCRAYALHSVGYTDEALADFDRAISIDENNTNALQYRSYLFSKTGRIDEALKDINRAIELGVNDAWAFRFRATIYSSMERSIDAIADYTKAIELDSSGSEAEAKDLYSRGQVYFALEQFDKALNDLERAASMSEKLRKAGAINRGLILSYLGRYKEAIDMYKLALDSIDNRYVALYDIAVAAVRLKGIAAAKQEITLAHDLLNEKLKQPLTRGAAIYGLGGLEAVSGNVDQALSYLRESISLGEQGVNWARNDVAWLDLRDNPEFKALIS